MFKSLDDVRESLIVARLLRESILAIAVRPDGATRLRAQFLRENASGRQEAMATALSDARDPGLRTVTREHLQSWSAKLGARPRSGPGEPFQGRPAPAPADIEDLVEELLETVNSPVAQESWPPPFRAFALHFLLRLVQPVELPESLRREATFVASAALAATAEAALLAADGFSADRMLLPEPDAGAATAGRRPDVEAFARARLHRLVERLGESETRVRAESARGVLLGWVEERAARLNARQERLLFYLAEGGGERRLVFQDYVRLHAGRRAPSLRSMQRDWQELREGGWISEGPDGRFAFDPEALAFGRD